MINKNTYNHPELKGKLLIVLASILLVMSVFCKQASSQTETLTVAKPDSIIKYISPLDYAFMMHEETSWLIKLMIEDYHHGNSFYFAASIEKRVAPSFTLALGIDNARYVLQSSSSVFGFQSSLESRWYYRLNNRIKNDKVARNMSDNYLAVGVSYIHLPSDQENNFMSIYAKWGLQRRFLKHGHADIGIKAGLGIPSNKNNSPSLLLTTYVNLGLVFTKDKYILDHEKLCPILKCYDAENFIVKSSLGSLFSVSLFKNQKTIYIAPHIALERKIGSSAFSINSELQTDFVFHNGYSDYDSKYYNTSGLTANLLLEGRWYYNLKRRILNGYTGNGLSANYIALGGSYNYDKPDYHQWHYGSFRPGIHLITGWQRLFSKHMYYDINLGIEYRPNAKWPDPKIEPRFRIGVGYRF
ncbi:MAG: hypothetical protein HOO86_11880 [Bacteroidales bacterium]|nr:hypothetical protein [Bacteroidales bacterium]